MAVDPSDIQEPPYGLGECVENADIIEVHCKTMFNEGYLITSIPMRRRGDFVQVILHEIFISLKTQNQNSSLSACQMKIPGLERTEFQGGSAVWIQWLCIKCRQHDNEICICQIDIDAEGNVYIAPKGHNEGFTTSRDPIGICATTISFLVDDSEAQEVEEEEEETEEPETKIIKLG